MHRCVYSPQFHHCDSYHSLCCFERAWWGYVRWVQTSFLFHALKDLPCVSCRTSITLNWWTRRETGIWAMNKTLFFPVFESMFRNKILKCLLLFMQHNHYDQYFDYHFNKVRVAFCIVMNGNIFAFCVHGYILSRWDANSEALVWNQFLLWSAFESVALTLHLFAILWSVKMLL